MADVYFALNGGGLTGSPPDPAITEPPEPYDKDILKRQNVGTYDVCGYYSIPGQFWVANYCYYSGVSTTTCATSSSHIGCDGYIKTRCFTSLTCTSTSSDELCCASGCVTAISTDSDGDELTLYPFCTTKDMEVAMYQNLEGVSASIETSIESTSEPTSSDGELTAKTGTTGESKTQEITSSAESSSSSGPDSSSKSSAPVGAIVGGVLGGLALLTLIGFGLWFIRHKKRQAGNGSHVVAATDQPPVVPYYQQQPVTHAQGEVNYQPLSSGTLPEPKAYSPSSNMRHSAFNELQSFHHDSTNPAGPDLSQLEIVLIAMRLIFILAVLQGAVLAQKAQTQTKEFCETRMSRTPVSDTPRVTISTKVKLTASKPYCNRKNKHETFKVKLGPVTSTVVTRSIYTSSVTAPQKVKTLTITKTLTETAVTTPTFIKTDTTVYTTTSTLTSTVTVPTVSGFVPLALVSGSASRKRRQSKRTLPRKNAWEDNMHVLPSRVFPRNAKPKPESKPKNLKDPCTIRIESGDKNHPVQPTQTRGAVACYKSVQITKTVLFKSCIAWTKTITLDQKTVTKHDITRGWVTSTVTEADTTMTADDTATTTSTLTKATTTKTTTETETVTRTDLAPAESSWAACNADNLINAANGGHGINAVNIGLNRYNVLPLVTPYDCCVECQKRPNCIFSVAYHHKCYLVIGTACLPDHTFDTSFTTSKKLHPENGPTLSNGHCGRIRNAGDAG
ncbi:hypothetical protein CEK26_002493 [Fusarium fujikuroi]|nr:hypothetical protein CEK27_002489 [Fusarium fujikuroi]QGJ01049.1 hypothetical protein CEK26_002493 [Fusarium fujikuroi]